ncbi:hypothetical protein BDW59DRAFT_60429 [Aspergillus cavernicola]|uniref:Uncharacterized protein n=1 Tax=Aspergillus cavernicola TaxID=176166 RepID=A0ABR4H6R2_9EURO
MDISSALDFLRSTPPEVLQRHRQEVLSTLEHVGHRLRSVLWPNTSSECMPMGSSCSSAVFRGLDQSDYDEGSESEPSARGDRDSLRISSLGPMENDTNSETRININSESSQVTLSRQKPAPAQDWPMKLLASSKADLYWLYGLKAKKPADIIEERRSQGRNYRIEDIQKIDGKTTPGKLDALFRGFAQRSMGLELTKIQHDAEMKTRVDELCESICSSDPEIRARIHRRSGIIAKKLHLFHFAPDDKEIVLRGINAGVKQLVLETLFEKRLKELGRPVKCAGLSVIAAMGIKAFRLLHFADMPRYIDLLLPPSLESEVTFILLPTNRGEETTMIPIADMIIELSPWVAKFQDVYDSTPSDLIHTPVPARVNPAITTNSHEPPPKRMRLLTSQLEPEPVLEAPAQERTQELLHTATPAFPRQEVNDNQNFDISSCSPFAQQAMPISEPNNIQQQLENHSMQFHDSQLQSGSGGRIYSAQHDSSLSVTEDNCEQASWTYGTNPEFLGDSCPERPTSSFARGRSDPHVELPSAISGRRSLTGSKRSFRPWELNSHTEQLEQSLNCTYTDQPDQNRNGVIDPLTLKPVSFLDFLPGSTPTQTLRPTEFTDFLTGPFTTDAQQSLPENTEFIGYLSGTPVYSLQPTSFAEFLPSSSSPSSFWLTTLPNIGSSCLPGSADRINTYI